MAKQTSYTTMNGISMTFKFNVLVGNNEYQPLIIYVNGQATTPEGATTQISETQNVGTVQTSPLTIQQIYSHVNAFNTTLGSMVKQLCIDGIAVDPSA